MNTLKSIISLWPIALIIGGVAYFVFWFIPKANEHFDHLIRAIEEIEDPTERGLVCVALSIVLLTFVIAVKTFSHREVTTKHEHIVKKDRK